MWTNKWLVWRIFLSGAAVLALTAGLPAQDVPPRQTIDLKNTAKIESIAFSPDGKVIASAGETRRILLWDAATGKRLANLAGHTGRVATVCFSPDGKLLASAGDDGTIRLWDAGTGAQVALLALPGSVTRRPPPVNALAFSPDGKFLVSAQLSALHVWDVAGRHLGSLVGTRALILSVAFSPDGKVVAAGDTDGAILLWETSTSRKIGTLANPEREISQRRITALAFSPDGKTLAAGSLAKVVQLWDLATGRSVAALDLGGEWNGTDTRVAFSPDGKTLATATLMEVRLWDTTTRKVVATLAHWNAGEGLKTHAIAFSPAGKTFAAAGWLQGSDTTSVIRIWDTPPKQR